MTYIKITTEINLEDFEAWSGGLDTLNAIKKHEEASEILEYLASILTEDEGLTETQVNDFLWFDAYDLIIEAFDIDLYE